MLWHIHLGHRAWTVSDKGEFDPAEHPQAPAGSSKGGQFVKKGTGGGPTAKPSTAKPKAAAKPKEPKPPPAQTTPNGQRLPGSAEKSNPYTIATAKQKVKGAVEGDRYRRPDLESMKRDPRVFEKNMELLKNRRFYPNFRRGEFDGKTPNEIAEIAKEHAKANLRFLYESAPKTLTEQSHVWYEGAHDLAAATAKKYNLPLQ